MNITHVGHANNTHSAHHHAHDHTHGMATRTLRLAFFLTMIILGAELVERLDIVPELQDRAFLGGKIDGGFNFIERHRRGTSFIRVTEVKIGSPPRDAKGAKNPQPFGCGRRLTTHSSPLTICPARAA